MIIWNVTIGEPLPTDAGEPRLYRAGIVCTTAAQNNHDVVWWSSTFNHHTKTVRWTQNQEIQVSDRLQIQALHGEAYTKNVSLARIRNHQQMAKQFTLLAPKYPKPDVIIASFPDIHLTKAVVQFAKENKIPIVVDVRDLWPDIFPDLLPSLFQWPAKMLLNPLFADTKFIFESATSIIAITQSFLNWGLLKGTRKQCKNDAVFPMAYPQLKIDKDLQEQADSFWLDDFGLDESLPILCFFGTLGKHFDINTVVDAALLERCKDIHFVICGTGENLEGYKKRARTAKNIHFPGWIGKDKIISLMKKSFAGLAPYYNGPNFEGNIPNKPIEYLSGHLPIMTCLKGELQALIESYDCGLFYHQGNPESLGDAINVLAQDHARQQRMASNAYELYLEKYQAERIYSDLIEHLKRCSKKTD